MVGGGMRQAGILAVAGKMALTDPVPQLKVDHANAKLLAELLNTLPGFKVNAEFVQTNIVFAKLDESIDINTIAEKLKQETIIISPGNPIRFVTHQDVSEQDILTLVEKIKSYL
jgi:threonine aldolase